MQYYFARLSDLPEYADSVARWYFEHWVAASNPNGYVDVLDKVLASTRQQSVPFIVLALSQQTLVGAVEVKCHDDDNDGRVWLDGVYIDENYRGQGIARQLVLEALSQTRMAGFNRVYLKTKALNGGLYRHCGFKPLISPFDKASKTLLMEAHLD
ncbi:hypothetical protein BGP77_04305 [Saccharospirillum sp. MSK14-1]|uniref:GNAT family N-acetyltransferase n=1 Tax=Saccharospirillum sp. MSK14-1 TaxID=1897632 RepID=UPI000D35349E|nr:GNAT family N-acetyltransferase [Saccharospirillum sp. MSK14-1]PTY36525.1 hypothetical protein BGP77_04305 [Saccharospirillum sp. MSK14-1]